MTADATTERTPAGHHSGPGIAGWIRRFAVLVILGWLVLIAVSNVVVPQLEEVGKMRTVSMSPQDAPSFIAMKRVGSNFAQFSSDSSVMIVLEGDQPLGAEAHEYYDRMIKALVADSHHVQNVQDFWGDPLTASGSQSNDGKAAYVQVYLNGNQGETLANESVEAVQHIIADLKPPAGLNVYVTGAAAQLADQNIAGDRSLQKIEIVTFVVIITMLLLVYRSLITVVLVLVMVVMSLSAARGVVAVLGYYQIIGLSTFATNLLVTLAIAASTDYAIFLIGRYQEARGAGEDRETAYYTMFHGTAHVVLGSGLTIAGATFCLHFTRLPYFQTLGIPLAIGMVTVVVVALTMGSAIIVVATRFGKVLEPKRLQRVRGWRKMGALITRWPAPVLVGTVALALVGLVTLPGYETSYNDRKYMPPDLPANEGYAAADRHFSPSRLNPELLMIESDHDLRNSADFLVIDKISKAVFRTPGIARVQSITRPQGTPIEHTSIPFQISMQGTSQKLNEKYLQDRMADMLTQSDEMAKTIETMRRMQSITVQMAATTHEMVTKTKSMALDVQDIRDDISNFDDFFRPLRAYFYWEPHCFDIPTCTALRSIFDTIDGVDKTSDDVQDLVPSLEKLDRLMPQLVALMPEMIKTMESMRVMMLTMYQSQKGMQDQMSAMQSNSTAMGEAFDASRNDDSFYVPPEIFDNADFKRGMKNFISPDGRSVRFIVAHDGDPLSPEGITHIDAIKQAAKEAIKGTPLEGSRVFLAGTAATFKDMSDGNAYDLLIAGIASLALIFIIMLIITRAVVASAVIVGTVLLSLAASFGLSVLIWQHIVGLELHWLVLAMSVIILLAVGADYNLLLVSRLKEEIHAGINTGIIRAMGGSGTVVTSAGLVFALTMMSMVASELKVIGQVGTTIGLGLLFDTLVVRAFMTPSIAALMGKWFWWPQRVRQRPVPSPWPTPREPDLAPTAG